jgi:DNA-binding NarL/FixJ family response regulator
MSAQTSDGESDSESGGAAEPPRRLKVAIVDDQPDVRLLLRLTLSRDHRFDVVGEATNGQEAIALVTELAPDLLILDRQMPVLGGVEALPIIKQRSPRTAVVLYTATSDAGTYQAAIAAGAVEVLEKRAVGPGFVEDLASVLAAHWAPAEADVEIKVGPVSTVAARAWIDNTSKILSAVQAHPEVIEGGIPDDVLELFQSFLASWSEVAVSTKEFRWAARADAGLVQRLVENWAAIDSLSDETLDRLGVHWSPPEGEPFFHALTAGVLAGLEGRDEMRQLADLIRPRWAG